jgi:hypothetical protein
MLAGRERELARVDAFVAATSGGARGLLVRGAAGIGKTAIWWAALDRLRAAEHLVLITRPAEEELRGTMIGLLDLFEDVDVVPAVLDPDTDLFDRGRAVLATIRRLTDSGPVVLAIDDLQWLDPISARSPPSGLAQRRLRHRCSCPTGPSRSRSIRSRSRRSGRCSLQSSRRSPDRRSSSSTSCLAATRCTPSSSPARPT